LFSFFFFLSATFFSPSGFSEADGVLFLFLNVYSDFFKTNYLNIHRTDLYEICRDGRTLSVRERPAVIFRYFKGNFLLTDFYLLNPHGFFYTFSPSVL